MREKIVTPDTESQVENQNVNKYGICKKFCNAITLKKKSITCILHFIS